MAGGKLRKLVWLAVIGGAIAAVLKKLRGEPAPQFANHPTVRGGPELVPSPLANGSVTDAQIEAELDLEDELIEEDLAELELVEELAEELVAEAIVEEIVEAELEAELEAQLTEAEAEDLVADVIDTELAEGAWVDPVDGQCPEGFPIKAKLSSGIYHQPGGFSYERTKPDRCYASAAAAEADGLRPAKR